ncbi:MAG: prepilin-type N-terminal cleavage/methylation domain-containing protein [Bacilli bacterium]|nr:prepilin-type N-terminal cleavage/methylation domain-containing protein [Bacilli bacterium]
MNKKGFTLVELLSSMAIITMIATIACINIAKVFTEKEKISTENKNSIIETAACVYIDLDKNINLKNTCFQTGCRVSTDDLIKKVYY